MNKRKGVFILVLLLIGTLIGLCSCGNDGIGSKTLSEYALGEWQGQADVAKIMYRSLEDELGIDLSPEPEYCDVSIRFNDDNTCIFTIDADGFAEAVGKCAEPYVSAIIGFDTEALVDIIMQYVANDMPVDSGVEKCTYTVDEDQLIITVLDESGDENIFYLMEDGSLQYEDKEIGQVISFQKL